MKDKKCRNYWFLAIAGVLIAAYYPISMGVRVISDMITNGSVTKEDYPKYIIPYTPIALAVLAGVLLMPLLFKLAKRIAVFCGAAFSCGIFFALELLFENKVVISHTDISGVVAEAENALSDAALEIAEFAEQTTTVIEQSTEVIEQATTRLADWQMYMCVYQPDYYSNYTYSEPDFLEKFSSSVSENISGISSYGSGLSGYAGESAVRVRTETPVDILIGDYNPAFKLHFYIISVVLIIAILNCIYGFALMLQSADMKRKKTLILQSVATAAFLGLCILACFTSFWRDGSIQVSPLSAALMIIFFIILGLTVGIFAGSFLLGKRKLLSLWVPAAVSAAMTTVMYCGEMILLHSNLYRFGTGFFFEEIPGIVLAPVDILVIIASGAACYCLMRLANSKKTLAAEAC